MPEIRARRPALVTTRRPASTMNENICLGLLALLLFGYLTYVLIRPEEF